MEEEKLERCGVVVADVCGRGGAGDHPGSMAMEWGGRWMSGRCNGRVTGKMEVGQLGGGVGMRTLQITEKK